MSKMSKMSKKKKTTHTYSIDDNIYEEFSKMVDERMLNKSKVIENLIQSWISLNDISNYKFEENTKK
jgi:hypothetical protein